MTSSVVVSSKNRPQSLRKVVECLCAQTEIPAEIFIVDASTIAVPADDILAQARSTGIRAEWVRQFERNGGFHKTATWNAIVARAVGDVIFFLDDDVVPQADYLKQHLAIYEGAAGGSIAAVKGNVVNRGRDKYSETLARLFMLPGPGNGRIKRSGYQTHDYETPDVHAVDTAGTGVLSVRASVCREVAFDEWFHDASIHEDMDFTYRLSRKHKLVQSPTPQLVHEHALAGRPDQRAYHRMAALNHYYFFRKNMPKSPLNWACFFWSETGMLLTLAASFTCTKSVLKSLLGVYAWRNRTALAGRLAAHCTIGRHLLFGGPLQ